jgi:hypothetical protein
MIRPPSDKCAGGREPATWVRQCPCAVKKWNTQNKSIPHAQGEVSNSPSPLPKFMASQPVRGVRGSIFWAVRGHFRPKTGAELPFMSDIPDNPLSEMSDGSRRSVSRK